MLTPALAALAGILIGLFGIGAALPDGRHDLSAVEVAKTFVGDMRAYDFNEACELIDPASRLREGTTLRECAESFAYLAFVVGRFPGYDVIEESLRSLPRGRVAVKVAVETMKFPDLKPFRITLKRVLQADGSSKWRVVDLGSWTQGRPAAPTSSASERTDGR